MAIKTFTGTTLSSSDVNTYLANAGLVYVTSASATAGSSQLVLDNCFTSTYDNYRMLLDFFQPATAGQHVLLQFRAAGTNAQTSDYYFAYRGLYVDGTSADYTFSAVNSINLRIYNSANTIGVGAGVYDIFAPYKTERTHMTAQGVLYNTQFGSFSGMCEHNLTNAYDGIRLFPTAGNITSLRCTIYGYRKA